MRDFASARRRKTFVVDDSTTSAFVSDATADTLAPRPHIGHDADDDAAESDSVSVVSASAPTSTSTRPVAAEDPPPAAAADHDLASFFRTGDLIFYDRKCSMMSPFGAALCVSAKLFSNTPWDHVAMVIRNHKDGTVYLADTGFAGVRMYPLHERLLRTLPRVNTLAFRRLHTDGHHLAQPSIASLSPPARPSTPDHDVMADGSAGAPGSASPGSVTDHYRQYHPSDSAQQRQHEHQQQQPQQPIASADAHEHERLYGAWLREKSLSATFLDFHASVADAPYKDIYSGLAQLLRSQLDSPTERLAVEVRCVALRAELRFDSFRSVSFRALRVAARRSFGWSGSIFLGLALPFFGLLALAQVLVCVCVCVCVCVL